jgi:hypothetical protein
MSSTSAQPLASTRADASRRWFLGSETWIRVGTAESAQPSLPPAPAGRFLYRPLWRFNSNTSGTAGHGIRTSPLWSPVRSDSTVPSDWLTWTDGARWSAEAFTPAGGRAPRQARSRFDCSEPFGSKARLPPPELLGEPSSRRVEELVYRAARHTNRRGRVDRPRELGLCRSNDDAGRAVKAAPVVLLPSVAVTAKTTGSVPSRAPARDGNGRR